MDKDILKIPMDLSSAGQQLKDSKNNMKIRWKIKKSCIYSTKSVKFFLTKITEKQIFFSKKIKRVIPDWPLRAISESVRQIGQKRGFGY